MLKLYRSKIPSLQPSPVTKPLPTPSTKPPHFEPDDQIIFDTDALWDALKTIGIVIVLVIVIIAAIAAIVASGGTAAPTVTAIIALLISYGLSEQQAKEIINKSGQKVPIA
jgi:hypothetical protein